MPLTKTTPRKQTKCPMCSFKTWDMDELKNHLGECGLGQIQKRFRCDECSYSTNKNANLIKTRRNNLRKTKSLQNALLVHLVPQVSRVSSAIFLKNQMLTS